MKELYSIRFAHVVTDKDILCTTYTIDFSFVVGTRVMTPVKMTLNKDKTQITVDFDDSSSHVLWYTEDVECFYREKEADKTKTDATQKTNGKTPDKVKPRRVRKSGSTK